MDGLARDKANAEALGLDYDYWSELPADERAELLAEVGLEEWDAEAERKGTLIYGPEKTPCDLQAVLNERFDIDDCGDQLLNDSYAYLNNCPRCGEGCEGHQMCLRHINELQDVVGQPNFFGPRGYNS